MSTFKGTEWVKKLWLAVIQWCWRRTSWVPLCCVPPSADDWSYPGKFQTWAQRMLYRLPGDHDWRAGYQWPGYWRVEWRPGCPLVGCDPPPLQGYSTHAACGARYITVDLVPSHRQDKLDFRRLRLLLGQLTSNNWFMLMWCVLAQEEAPVNVILKFLAGFVRPLQ